jgi:hypothetical protein
LNSGVNDRRRRTGFLPMFSMMLDILRGPIRP